MCNNKTTNGKCADQSDIDKLASNILLTLYKVEEGIDFYNTESIFKRPISSGLALYKQMQLCAWCYYDM